MRIHRLAFRGIGPFRDEFRIDFDQLGDDGVFLLDGPTGSGKSTVIDAIVFALYGGTAGDTSNERLVSDFLGPGPYPRGQRPYVELVFSTDQRVLRVRREPDYGYVNSNGNPGTKNGTILLESLTNEADETGEKISDKWREANQELIRLIGLDKAQFLSTIVLAQGEFSTFLKATSEVRREILERVFNTADFARLERHLIEGGKAARDRRATAEQNVKREMSAFCQAANLAADEREEWVELAATDPSSVRAQVEAVLGGLSAQVKYTLAQHDLAKDEEVKALEVKQKAERLASLIKGRRDLLAEQGRLVDEAPDVAHTRHRLRRAERALRLTGQYDAWHTAKERFSKAESRWLPLRDELPEALRDAAQEDLAAERERLVSVAARLEPVKALEAGLPRKASALNELRGEAERGEVVASTLARDVCDGPRRIQDLRVARDEAITVASSLSMRQRQLEDLRAVVELSRELTQTTSDYELAQASLGKAERTYLAAKDDQRSKETAYHRDIAGQLARDLTPGQPCLVCGAVEHPTPAQVDGEGVTREAVLKARESEESTHGVWQKAKHREQMLGARVAELTARLGKASPSELPRELSAAEHLVAVAQAAQDSIAGIESQIREMEDTLEESRRRQVTLSQELSALAERVKSMEADLVANQRDVDVDRAEYPSVAERLAVLVSLARTIASAVAARADQDTAQRQVAEAFELLTAGLAEQGFEDTDEVMAAKASSRDREVWQQEVAAHEAATKRVQEELASEDFSSVDETTEVDVEGPSRAAMEAEMARLSARDAMRLAESVAHSAELAWQQVEQSIGYAEQVRVTTAPELRLAGLAGGKTSENRLGIPLSHYVVMRRFAEVVAAANDRLQKMSEDQYRLESDSAAVAGREQRKGLGLVVYDQRTDAARPPSSLSGGETFYTSLSLALGLADVVASEAGGVQMRTLFVDEGFGSLDAETLDSVMSVLNDLGHGDRTVGLISHVEEMKNRIPDRIQVRRVSRDGPSEVVNL